MAFRKVTIALWDYFRQRRRIMFGDQLVYPFDRSSFNTIFRAEEFMHDQMISISQIKCELGMFCSFCISLQYVLMY